MLLLMFFMNTVSSRSREDFIVSTFLIIKFNAESTDKDLFTILENIILSYCLIP